MSRKLSLRKEVLTVLSDDALAGVAGGQQSIACINTVPCITPSPMTFDLKCYLTGDACS